MFRNLCLESRKAYNSSSAVAGVEGKETLALPTLKIIYWIHCEKKREIIYIYV